MRWTRRVEEHDYCVYEYDHDACVDECDDYVEECNGGGDASKASSESLLFRRAVSSSWVHLNIAWARQK